jgi:hypothetical protein
MLSVTVVSISTIAKPIKLGSASRPTRDQTVTIQDNTYHVSRGVDHDAGGGTFNVFVMSTGGIYYMRFVLITMCPSDTWRAVPVVISVDRYA